MAAAEGGGWPGPEPGPRAVSTAYAIAAALVAVVVGAWWKVRGAERRAAADRAGRERAELERDAAGGRAAVAEAQADVAADHANRIEAGAAAAEEIRRVSTSLAPADRVRALDDAARRLHAEDGARPGAGGGDAAAVRDPSAPGRRR